MPELDRRSPDNPDFARVVDLSGRARASTSSPFDIAPTAAEAAALARLMGARAVRKLRFAAAAARAGRRLAARRPGSARRVVQTCVVTLDPVTTRIDQPVARRYLPGAPRGRAGRRSRRGGGRDEPLRDRLDLGLVATEALALALPAYPRKPGAGARRPAAGRRRGEVRSPSRRWRRSAASSARAREPAAIPGLRRAARSLSCRASFPCPDRRRAGVTSAPAFC